MFEGLFQPMHLLLILGIALLFFGPKRLPELGKGLGTSIRDFRDAMSGAKGDDKQAQQLEAPKATSTASTVSTASAMPVQQAAAQPAPAAQQAPPGGSSAGSGPQA